MQIGVGIEDNPANRSFHHSNLGFSLSALNETGDAPLMKRYTGEIVHRRKANLSFNVQGGGGLELWSFTSKEPIPPNFSIELGDLGIFAAILTTNNIQKAWDALYLFSISKKIGQDPAGNRCFFITFPNNKGTLYYKIVQSDSCFIRTKAVVQGVAGAIIGVKKIEKSLPFYRDFLGYDKIIYDVICNQSYSTYLKRTPYNMQTLTSPSTPKHSKPYRRSDIIAPSPYHDIDELPGAAQLQRRIALTRSKPSHGPFSHLFGDSHLILVETKRTPRKIFSNRHWGDLGFIHICFAITNLNSFIRQCGISNLTVTVDSGKDFTMDNTNARFCYLEDPDGTLIEFVETFKIPIVKSWNLNLDIVERLHKYPLHKWRVPKILIRMMGLVNRSRNIPASK